VKSLGRLIFFGRKNLLLLLRSSIIQLEGRRVAAAKEVALMIVILK
jgi:hypothetical protein